MPDMKFRDRSEAGLRLSAALREFAQEPDELVLGLPRGGVPVAFSVAQQRNSRLDVFVVRKLGVPGHDELAMGAIASGGTRVLNDQVIEMLGVSGDVIGEVAEREQRELERRERAYRGDRSPAEVRGRRVILVDDGLATGSTMRAAVAALREREPKELVVAVPVAARETCEALKAEVDAVVCASTPEPFHAVGLWYEDFAPTTDEEVRDLLERAVEAHWTPPGTE